MTTIGWIATYFTALTVGATIGLVTTWNWLFWPCAVLLSGSVVGGLIGVVVYYGWFA